MVKKSMEKKEQDISKGLKEIEKILGQKDKLYEYVSIYSSNHELGNKFFIDIYLRYNYNKSQNILYFLKKK
jgi:effector-binding domain-containing protein